MKKLLLWGLVFVGIFSVFSSYASTFPTPSGIMCTAEAKMCPDGKTFVGRTGPNCEFSACPKDKGIVFPEVKACTREYVPVCGQPKQNRELAIAPKTYSNMCVMESENAMLINHGKCIADYGEKAKQRLDTGVDSLIQKIDETISNINTKIVITGKLIERLQKKAVENPQIEALTNYIVQKLKAFLTRFND